MSRVSSLCLLAVPLLFLAAAELLSADYPPASRWESTIAAFEEADRENPPPAGGILFIGSSSIRGWRSVADDFPDYQVINRGFGGSIIADSTAFAERIVLPYKPAVILFYAGENDLTAGIPVEQVVEDFKTFVARVHAELPETRVAFIAMKPSPRRAHLIETKRIGNDLVRAFARSTPRVDFLDVFHPMLNGEGEPRAELFVGDQLHLNSQGYTLWKAIVGGYLQGVQD